MKAGTPAGRGVARLAPRGASKVALPALAAALSLALAGCEAGRSMRDDLARLTGSPAALQKSQPARPAARPRPTTATAAPADPSPPPGTLPSSPATSLADPPAPGSGAPAPPTAGPLAPVPLAGRSEKELRALLGAPTSEVERPPGKLWRYRDGSCTLDLQLYPDVQTKQFGTLAYEVKSDDNSDEGKRACLAQFQARAQNRP